MLDRKTCSKCGEMKPLGSYYRDVHYAMNVGPWCKSCVAARNKMRDAAAYRKKYAKPPPKERQRAERKIKLRKKFGITLEQYDELLTQQDGVCAICRRPEWQRSKHGELKALAVDHDHETKEVRGLLCHACNVGIGYFEEDVNRMIDATVYLAKKARDNADSAVTPPLVPSALVVERRRDGAGGTV